MSPVRKEFEEWMASKYPEADLTSGLLGYTDSYVHAVWVGFQAGWALRSISTKEV